MGRHRAFRYQYQNVQSWPRPHARRAPLQTNNCVCHGYLHMPTYEPPTPPSPQPNSLLDFVHPIIHGLLALPSTLKQSILSRTREMPFRRGFASPCLFGPRAAAVERSRSRARCDEGCTTQAGLEVSTAVARCARPERMLGPPCATGLSNRPFQCFPQCIPWRSGRDAFRSRHTRLQHLTG